MKDVKRNPDTERMHGYMEKLGSNHYDYKTRKAYDNFKRPVWYLQGKDKSNEKTNKTE